MHYKGGRKMTYIKVGQTGTMQAGAKRKVTLNGKTLLLTYIQGNYYAIDDRCPHMGGSLSAGELEGDRITCPKHGTSFDVKTGKVVQNGKVAFFKLNVRDAHTYPVKVEGTDILVGID